MFFHMHVSVWARVTNFHDYRCTSHPHNNSGRMFPIVDMHNIFMKHLCQGSHIMLIFLCNLIRLSLKVSAMPDNSEHSLIEI